MAHTGHGYASTTLCLTDLPKAPPAFPEPGARFYALHKTEIPQANDPASEAAQNTSYPPVQPVPMSLPSPVSYTRGLAETIRFAVLVLCKTRDMVPSVGVCAERDFSQGRCTALGDHTNTIG